jgi:thiol-disulfide isomerase/thioredoxin
MPRLILIIASVMLVQACRPAAAPVSVENKPVSVNGVPVNRSESRPLKPIGEMSWTDRVDGRVQKLKDFGGKVVILDFWATYCPPCIEEIPHLMDLKSRYGDDLVVIGLHVGGEEDLPKVPEFIERLKITYPIAMPEDALTSFVFGQESAIPQTAVFDRSGKLVKKIAGFSPQIKTELDAAIAQAIAKS